MNIREFTEQDKARIFEIYAHSKLDELKFENTQFELLPLDKDKTRLTALTESDIYVYEDGAILGYGAICGSEIRALFVSPHARGKGIGEALLVFLLSKIQGKARLYVAKTNEPAKTLYQKYGFTVSAEFITHYNGKPVLANEMVS